jgi:hypothetical protein
MTCNLVIFFEKGNSYLILLPYSFVIIKLEFAVRSKVTTVENTLYFKENTLKVVRPLLWGRIES